MSGSHMAAKTIPTWFFYTEPKYFLGPSCWQGPCLGPCARFRNDLF